MRIVFQGDSVTDAGRDRSHPHNLGEGYPKYAAEELKKRLPGKELEFLNLGVSGNRSCQLFDRIYDDAIKLKPDIVSVLIGINDAWHRYSESRIETTDEQFTANLRAILSRLKNQTDAKIVVLAPFLLDCGDKEEIRRDLETILPVVRALAAEYADVYIPLDRIFEEALKTQPAPRYYSVDGVHPNENGSRFIGKVYAEYVEKLI